MTIGDEEQGRRWVAVDRVRHDARLEGQRVTKQTRADQDEYVAGATDLEELGRRARTRHGVE
ncbi:antitoxin VbhA family protein [Arthrobacter pigmenti]